MTDRRRFYLTTAIAYANNKPGLHTLYEVVGADVIARWHRMIGDETRFLTGTDEYSVNIATSAAEQGLERQEVRAAREVVSPNVCRIFDLIDVDGRELGPVCGPRVVGRLAPSPRTGAAPLLHQALVAAASAPARAATRRCARRRPAISCSPSTATFRSGSTKPRWMPSGRTIDPVAAAASRRGSTTPSSPSTRLTRSAAGKVRCRSGRCLPES